MTMTERYERRSMLITSNLVFSEDHAPAKEAYALDLAAFVGERRDLARLEGLTEWCTSRSIAAAVVIGFLKIRLGPAIARHASLVSGADVLADDARSDARSRAVDVSKSCLSVSK
jgi:hypothetical protein